MLENAVNVYIERRRKLKSNISKNIQVNIWKKLFGKGINDRSIYEIIIDIYKSRTKGKKVDL